MSIQQADNKVLWTNFLPRGCITDPEKIEELNHAAPPRTKNELRSFLGMTKYSAGFIQNYASLAAELRKFTQQCKMGLAGDPSGSFR